MICAYSSCESEPIVRMKTQTGWALFCRKHYDTQAQISGDSFCLKNGLDTTEKKIAFCKEKMGAFFKQAQERQPGEDDE